MKLTLKKSNSDKIDEIIESLGESRNYTCMWFWVFAPESKTSADVLLANSEFKLSGEKMQLDSHELIIDCSDFSDENEEHLSIKFNSNHAAQEAKKQIEMFFDRGLKTVSFECDGYSLCGHIGDAYGMPAYATLFSSKNLAHDKYDYSYIEGNLKAFLEHEECKRQGAKRALKLKQDSVKPVNLTLKKSDQKTIKQSIVSVCNSQGLGYEDQEWYFAPKFNPESEALLVSRDLKLLADDKEIWQETMPDSPLEGLWAFSISAGGTFSDLYLYFKSEDTAKEVLQKIDHFTNTNTEHLSFSCKHYFLNELALKKQDRPGIYERIILASSDKSITDQVDSWW